MATYEKRDRSDRDRKDPNAKQPVLVPQAKGGALWSGGTPGNRGGGRKSSIARQTCRDMFEKGLPYIEKIVEKGIDSDKIRAVDMFGKYGLGEAKVVVPEEVVEALVHALASEESIADDVASRVVQALFERLSDG